MPVVSRFSKATNAVQPIVVTEFAAYQQSRQDAAELGRSGDARKSDDRIGGTIVRSRIHRAFLFSMAVFGLFHPLHFDNTGAKWRLAMTAYSACILAYLTTNVLRITLTAFDGMMELSTANIITSATMYSWHVFTLLACAIQFITCCAGKKGLSSYYRKLGDTLDNMEAAGLQIKCSRIHTFEAACLVGGWIAFFVNIVYSLLAIADTANIPQNEYFLRWRMGGDMTLPEYETMIYVEAISVVFSAGANIFTVAYAIIICRQLSELWNVFNRNLDDETASRPEEVFESLGEYRRMYGEICETVASANESCLEYVFGTHLSFNLLLSMLQTYLIANSGNIENWPAMRVTVCVWLVTSLLTIGVEFSAGCMVIEKTRSCEEYLERIPETCGSGSSGSKQQIQLQLFLNQLKRDRGFTLFGLYPISKDALLPMIGTWITYILIIVQYGTPTNAGAGAAAAVAGAAVANSSVNTSSCASGGNC